MAKYAYERLSGLDTSFLLLESQDAYTHVASTLVFEGGPLLLADGGIDLEAIAKAHEHLLHRVKRYRQVLRFTPVTGHPVWVDDHRFDLSYHLRHVSLPRPGSPEQLKRLSARVMQQHLDRSRPLWETWVVEGLEDGRFALIAKVHHCMVDGLAGIDLLQVLLSSRPDVSVTGTSPRFQPRPEPQPWELVRDDLTWRARLPFEAARGVGALLRQAEDARAELTARARGALATVGMTLRGPSETPLNRPIGPHRRFDWCAMDLAEVRRVKTRLGGTVNDVVLAIASGAFRSFLRDRGVDLAGLDFRALAPVSVRRPEEQHELGNRVSGWILPLPLDEADPVARLRRIAEQTADLKSAKHALGAELLTGVVEWAPATLLTLAARAAARALPFNTIVTNVPGPQVPMYLLGAPLREVYPHVPLVDRVDLGIALMSYAGRLHWGLNADYDAVPDLDRFSRALQQAFDELREASEREAAEGGAAVEAAPAGDSTDEATREVEEPTREVEEATRPETVDEATRARRRGLSDGAREGHDALTTAIDGLERALTAPAALRVKPWSERVARELERVRGAIRAHVDGVELPEGLFDEVVAAAPRLAGRVASLRDEHESLVARASALAGRVPERDDADFGSLRDEAARLLTDLRAHHGQESDLVYEAFWTEIGGGD